MLRFPIVNRGVTLTEIPNRMSVFFEFGGCKCRCKGCHSKDTLWTPIAGDLHTLLEDMLAYVKQQKEQGANAVVLMGGTHNHGVAPKDYIRLIERLGAHLPVGVYSGLSAKSGIHSYLSKMPQVHWLKVGEYQQARGGLDNPGTNQQFYARSPLLGRWLDMTHAFQKQEATND